MKSPACKRNGLCLLGCLLVLIPAMVAAQDEATIVAHDGRDIRTIRTWYVSGDGADDAKGGSIDAPFLTIQFAIDSASPGDIVNVTPGTYQGPGNRDLDFAGKPLVLMSATDDPADVVIICEGSAGDPHRGFVFHTGEDSTTVVRALTITGGYAASGGAVVLESAASTADLITARFENCIFESNGAEYGGAVALLRDQNGYVSHEPQFVDCRFRENTATQGGAIHQAYYQRVRCTGCRFYRNHATGGGAIYSAWAAVDANRSFYVDCTFRENTADNGAGMWMNWEQFNVLSSCWFVGNAAVADGGGYYDPQGYSRIGHAGIPDRGREQAKTRTIADQFFSCDFDSNQATRGAGIYVGGLGDWQLTDCRLRWNTASEGGAIFSDTNSDTYTGCLFEGNTADRGAAVRFRTWQGGAHNGVRIENATVIGNTSQTGGILDFEPLQTTTWLTRCLVVFNSGGPAVAVADQQLVPTIACTDIFGNEGGDWVGPVAPLLGQDGNIAADPLICDVLAGDYTLAADSPCVPGNHPDGADCGIIGAYGIGCEAAVVASLTPLPATSGPITCGEVQDIAFHYVPGPTAPACRAYSVRIVATGPATFSPVDVTVFTVPAGEQADVQITENAPNDCTVAYTLLDAGTPGFLEEADLFTITFHADDDGDASIQTTEADFRDLGDQSFPVDHIATASIGVDCTPPGPVTDVLALPGDQMVMLTWTDPADTDLASIAVLRGLWLDQQGQSAYPLYGRAEGSTTPARPASLQDGLASGEWTLVAEVDPGAMAYEDDVAERDIYFYELFAVDGAGNASDPSAQTDASTNYLLGDVVPDGGDGHVDIYDVDALGDAYGLSFDLPGFSAVCDVGPTDDASGTGLPLPDGLVGFDDLVIFGMNFGEGAPGDLQLTQHVTLAWSQVADLEWSCNLVAPCTALKALRTVVDLPAGVEATVTAGALIDAQTAPVFLRNAGDAVDVGMCILGRGVGFTGTGELFRITLTAEADLSPVVFDARSVVNRPLVVNVVTAVDDALPRAFAVSPGYPNPFNPLTTIQFDLPESQHVAVGIYAVDGRLVKMLVDDALPPGHHAVTWNGTDARGRICASGTYVSRVQAGPHHATRKLVLAK